MNNIMYKIYQFDIKVDSYSERGSPILIYNRER